MTTDIIIIICYLGGFAFGSILAFIQYGIDKTQTKEERVIGDDFTLEMFLLGAAIWPLTIVGLFCYCFARFLIKFGEYIGKQKSKQKFKKIINKKARL